MLDYKIFLGALTLLIGLVSYSFYFRDIFRGKTKPDAFSWLIWSMLAGITFFAQVSKNGGAGTWITALTAIACLSIAITAFVRGDGHMKTIDGASIFGAVVGVALWYFTSDPLLAVICVIIVGAFGFIPTFRKAISNPQEETAITFLLNGLKFAIALFALQSFNLVTWLYPAALTAMNGSLAALLFFEQNKG